MARAEVRRELQDGDVIEAARTSVLLRTGSGDADPGDLVLDIGVGDLATVEPRLAAALTALERIARADVRATVGRMRVCVGRSQVGCPTPGGRRARRLDLDEVWSRIALAISRSGQ